jgi:fibrillarin-like pre-rRNA processing protein
MDFKVVETRNKGVFWDGERLWTRNSVPGNRVYGERLEAFDGVEYREWVPNRSKLGAYLRLGGKGFPFKEDSRVLYLGAASGTTASHVSDIVNQGMVYCIEISPRSFRDLVKVCEKRKNMVPILGDATRPQGYKFMAEKADIVYQDVAQKQQAAIFVRNFRELDAKDGLLALKARCEDTTREPRAVFAEAASFLKKEGLVVLDSLELEPFEKDHAMMAVTLR